MGKVRPRAAMHCYVVVAAVVVAVVAVAVASVVVAAVVVVQVLEFVQQQQQQQRQRQRQQQLQQQQQQQLRSLLVFAYVICVEPKLVLIQKEYSWCSANGNAAGAKRMKTQLVLSD